MMTPDILSNAGFVANVLDDYLGGLGDAQLSDVLGDNPFFAESSYRGDAENARDTEVWFIDKGPYVGQMLNPNDSLGYRTTTATTSGGFVEDYRSGIQITDSSSWLMDLGFGGIESISINKELEISDDWWDGFFNIGDWNSLGNRIPTQYRDGVTKSFVQRLNFGESFRFKEDPSQTVYTIGEVESGGQGNLLRHSNTVSAISSSDIENQQYHLISYSNNIASLERMNRFLWWVVDSNHGASVDATQGDGTTTEGNLSMAEEVGFNYTKNWKLNVTPSLVWDPMTDGLISGGVTISLPVASVGGNTCAGAAVGEDLMVFVTTLRALDSNGDATGPQLTRGMALHKYTSTLIGTEASLLTNLGATSNEFLVIRHIVEQTGYYELWLGGYNKPTSVSLEHAMANDPANKSPLVGTDFKFVQVGMNGYSDNSEFNINTMAPLSGFNGSYGKVGAVGYTIEFVEMEKEEDFLSDNPAVWETEPKETKDLDIYYEASPSFPIKIEDDILSKTIPVGSMLYTLGTGYEVIGHNQDRLVFSNLDTNFINGVFTILPDGSLIPNYFAILLPSGLEFKTIIDEVWFIDAVSNGYSIITGNEIKISTQNYNALFSLPWHNCFSYGNGVESNRIRDSFNLPYIINGVKASTSLPEYKEEHRKYGLIYSGIYNSISGINNLNQFIAAEKITKDVNPIYGSIQKLHSRDSDLVTLCEDKILKISADKDAVFNADGNPQLIATDRFLGQTIPFSGEFGISTNPESFASESYRVYFTDKVRGAVMRLSGNGLTPISNFGMNDWFKDNLKLSNRLIGSYDDKKEEYNLTLKNILYYPESIVITTSDGTFTTPNTKVEIQVENPPGLPFTGGGAGGATGGGPDPTTINQPSGGVGGSGGSGGSSGSSGGGGGGGGGY